MCTIRVFSRLSVTPSFSRIFVTCARPIAPRPECDRSLSVVRPPRELVSFVPHLLIEGGQQDIAQQRRYDSALRRSERSRLFPSTPTKSATSYNFPGQFRPELLAPSTLRRCRRRERSGAAVAGKMNLTRCVELTFVEDAWRSRLPDHATGAGGLRLCGRSSTSGSQHPGRTAKCSKLLRSHARYSFGEQVPDIINSSGAQWSPTTPRPVRSTLGNGSCLVVSTFHHF